MTERSIVYTHFKIMALVAGVLGIFYIGLLFVSLKNGSLSQADKSLAQVDPCGLGSSNANIATISPPQGQTFSLSCVVSNAVQYDQDQRFTFFQVTSAYSGLPYIKTANSQLKDNPTLSWNISLNRPSQLFLFFRRIPGVAPSVPSWASNYTRITPEGYSDVTQFMLRKNAENGLLGLYDIWKSNSSFLTGRVNFGPASDNIQAAPAYSMYIVAIKPQSSATQTASPTPPPTNSATPLPSGGGTLVTSGVVYNADSSANSSRSRATSIKVPETVVSTSQGWIAGRMKMGFPSTTTLSPDPNIFDMSQSDAESHFIYFDAGSDTFHFERSHTGGTVASTKQNFAIGDLKTVVVTWSPSQIKISVDGGTFATLNNSHVTAQAPFMIGHSPVQGASRQPNSDYYWVAAGSSFLTDANAQTIHSFGNTDHGLTDFPGNATFMWDASSDRYNTR